MHRELVELYFDGMDIEMLGSHFQKKAQEIYIDDFFPTVVYWVSNPRDSCLGPRDAAPVRPDDSSLNGGGSILVCIEAPIERG
jgi:hypothetical protein